MVKFMVLFHQPATINAFENPYNDFLALIERMPDIKRRQVVNVIGSPMGRAAYYRILEVYFDSQEIMETSLRSKAGQEAGGELVRRFPEGSFKTIFAEVYEEDGGYTPSTHQSTEDKK